MTAAEYAAAAVGLTIFGLSLFAGHGVGYARAMRVRRRRVGSPE